MVNIVRKMWQISLFCFENEQKRASGVNGQYV